MSETQTPPSAVVELPPSGQYQLRVGVTETLPFLGGLPKSVSVPADARATVIEMFGDTRDTRAWCNDILGGQDSEDDDNTYGVRVYQYVESCEVCEGDVADPAKGAVLVTYNEERRSEMHAFCPSCFTRLYEPAPAT